MTKIYPVHDKYRLKTKQYGYEREINKAKKYVKKMGFKVNKIVEPELTKILLQNNPRFKDYKDHPVGLIFYCSK